MLIAIIAMSAMLFFLCVLCAFQIGYKTAQGKKKPDVNNLSEEEKQKLEAWNKGFQNIMNYNENVAIKRKKVSN